jgi:hypothetical protein
MSQPAFSAQPGGYRQSGHCRPYVPAPPTYAPPFTVPMTWPGGPPAWRHRPPHAEFVDRRIFQVQISKHTGLVWAYCTQRYTITGTLTQCEAAIRAAQRHNLLAGWWSLTSLLICNWIALLENLAARKTLHHQAAHPYRAAGAGHRVPRAHHEGPPMSGVVSPSPIGR